MKVSRLALHDFRSYPREALQLDGSLVAFVGPNGAGKTNLLEAIHLAVQGFSVRTRRDAAMVRFGASAARVDAAGTRAREVPFTSVATLDARGGKQLVLDGAPITSGDELRKTLSALAFTPDRLAVVKGGPLVRRMYADRMLGRLLPSHADLPAEYARALAQRNAALRRVRVSASNLGALEPWDTVLVRLGRSLDEARIEAAAILRPQFAEVGAALGLGETGLAYRSEPLDDDALAERRARDIERGVTSVGPHLADIAITADARDLRAFGSQGEQRLAVLALVLAEARVLAETRGDSPLLLLDDVLSELDDSRRAALLACVPPGSQTVVTTTTTRAFPAHGPEPDFVVDITPGKATPR